MFLSSIRCQQIRRVTLPTLPLSEKQYAKLLATVPETFTGDKAQRVRALVRLMRYSGLAIRDAVTLNDPNTTTANASFMKLSRAVRRLILMSPCRSRQM
jgi:hypothetical protein